MSASSCFQRRSHLTFTFFCSPLRIFLLRMMIGDYGLEGGGTSWPGRPRTGALSAPQSYVRLPDSEVEKSSPRMTFSHAKNCLDQGRSRGSGVKNYIQFGCLFNSRAVALLLSPILQGTSVCDVAFSHSRRLRMPISCHSGSNPVKALTLATEAYFFIPNHVMNNLS